jgi:Cu-processing system ATP-binding protein
LYENQHFQAFLQADKQSLAIPETEKLAVLKQLLNDDNLTDIKVESADLEQLYQYYLKKNPNSIGASQ